MSASKPDHSVRDVQFCVRECAVFKFRRPPRPVIDPPRTDRPRLFAAGAAPGALVPLAPGQEGRAVALWVAGEAFRGIAEAGALVFFEQPRTPPSLDMLGHIVVVATQGEEVLARRLLRGPATGLFDLEDASGAVACAVALRWAAHIRAIIPPHQARRILGAAAPTEQGPRAHVALAGRVQEEN